MREAAPILIRSFDGADICLRRFARAGGPRLLLSHGNGFAMDGYRAFWTLLVDAFDVVLFDLRNHGTSGATPLEAHTIAAMAGDHAAVAAACREHFGARETYGVFHSVSAIAATIAGAAQSLWDGVVLVDPPLVSLDPATEIARSADDRLAQYARKRMQRFESVDGLAAEYAAGAGRTWAPGATLDMARAVTRPTPGGGVELVCPGEYEARIYEQNSLTDSFAALGAMRDPVAILGADSHVPRALHPAHVSRTAAQRYSLPYQAVGGAGHMLQIEKPESCAGALGLLLRSLAR